MHRYTDINKKALFVNKGIVPYRRKVRRGRKKVNYQLRYYFLIFFFFFLSFSYVFFKVLQDEDSIFKDIYHFFFTDSITSAKASDVLRDTFLENSPLPEVVKREETRSPLVDQKANQKADQRLANQGQVEAKALPYEIVTLYLAKFSNEKNAINFIPIPQRVAYQSRKRLLPNVVNALINFRSQEEKFNRFFSSKVKLKGYFIENETLVLNFNRFLENSKYGYKGLEVRLQQILWTLLNLKTDLLGKRISFISILIDGERNPRLGGDGFLLKPFYYRKDLKSSVMFH